MSTSAHAARGGLRDALLQDETGLTEPSGAVEPLSIEVEVAECAPDDPLLEVVTTWSGSSAQPPFAFRPLYRSPFWRGVAVHPASPFLFFFVIVAWWFVLFVPADRMSGWMLVTATVGLLLLTVPLVLMVATHLDRGLLLRLACSFEFWFMMGNVMGAHAAAIVEGFSASCANADRCFQALVAVPLAAVSVCVFSMDALVDVKAKWKAGMLFAYLLFFVFEIIMIRVDASTLFPDIQLCWLWCTSTRSTKMTCIATILTFAAKNTVCLLWYRGKRLLIIRPHATLLEDVAPADGATPGSLASTQ